jgi:glyoxylase-like metal-dependent hydrolase (beta-lactamase superfamily II)
MLKTTYFGEITRFDLGRTIAGRGRYWTTAYLVDNMMIDTGCAHTAGELESALVGSQISLIVNTHCHEDHFGANANLQRHYPELQVYAHPLAARVLANPGLYQPLQPYRRLFWGQPQTSEAQPIENGSILETKNYRFQVIYTPGHCLDHLCLYEPNQEWLFTGDLYVGGKDRALRAGCDIWQVIESLKMISVYPISQMFPNSARVPPEPAEQLQTKILYLEEMGERVMDLHQQGREVGEIARIVFGGPMWIELITLGHFTRRRLVLSYLGSNPEW